MAHDSVGDLGWILLDYFEQLSSSNALCDTVQKNSILRAMQPIQIQAVPVPISGFIASVNAGFPSPAADRLERDLNVYLDLYGQLSYNFYVLSSSQ